MPRCLDAACGRRRLTRQPNPLHSRRRPKIDVGVDPDDAFSSVPYEKGSNFLYFLETKLGGAEKMDDFLKAYIKRFSYKSITTQDFQDFVYEFFADKKAVLDAIEWESWYSMPGMPLTNNV